MKKALILTALALVGGGFLFGCASVGRNFDETKVSQIKTNETSEADLITLFGKPQNRMMNSSGQMILTWMYSESNVKGQSFIPFAGPFIGGTDTKTKTLNVTLQQGRVISFASSGGGTEMRQGTQDVPK
jgi:hypothetical protein